MSSGDDKAGNMNCLREQLGVGFDTLGLQNSRVMFRELKENMLKK